MMPTLEEALLYLGYDESDPMIIANVTRSLAAAVGLLKGAVGDDVETYLPDDQRIPELVLHYLDDLTADRGVTSSKANSAKRRLIADLELQLRLELRQAKEAASV